MKAKPLVVVLFFMLFIALFASGAIGSTDLTPDTPPAPTAVKFDAVFMGSQGVTAGQPCASPYTVRSGDTLTRIAQVCGIPLANLLAANPNILDPNVIREGQVVQIYYAPAEAAAAAPAVALPPTAAPTAVLLAFLSQTRPEGLRPGGTLHVILKDLPPASLVRIGIGKEGDQPLLIDERTTGADGGLTLKLAIPLHAKTGEHWVVTITNPGPPEIKVTSVPFAIE